MTSESSAAHERQREWIRRLAALPGRPHQELLEQSTEFHRPEVVEQIQSEVAHLVLVDLDQADRLTEAAGWIAETLDDDYCRALSLRASGHVLYARSRYSLAAERYQAALALFERLNREAEVGRTLSSALQALAYLGQYDQASAWAERARGIFTRLGDRLRLARLDSNAGNILYRQDRYAEALHLYERAREEFRDLGEPRDVAAVLSNMAVCSISRSEFDRALGYYREARIWCEQQGMPLLVAEADYNIAYLHYLRGEYKRAIELYQTTREHCAKLGDVYHEALCDLDQAEMYLELNLTEEGAELAQRAFDRFQNLRLPYESAKALTNLGLARNHLGEARASLRLLRQAQKIFNREKNVLWSASLDLYQALVLYRERRLKTADRFARRALNFLSPSPAQGKAALCELLLARLLLESGQNVKAKQLCGQALQRLDPQDAPATSFHLHLLMGQIEEALNPNAAYREYKIAQETAENLRSGLASEEVKIAFLKDKVTVYENLVWMRLERIKGGRKYEEAFAYIEAAKSRSLADLIAFHAHALPSRVSSPKRLATKVHALRKELNWHYHQMELVSLGSERISVRHMETLRRQARSRETQLARILSGMRAADQEFAALQGLADVSLDAIRSALPDDTAMLEYYVARDVIYACVLGSGCLDIVPVARADRVRMLLRLLHFQLSKFRLGPAYLRHFAAELRRAAEAHLQELYAELIGPVRSLLDARHLVVVPHAFLHYLPFHALQSGRQYMAEAYTMSYAPSGTVYSLCSRKAPEFEQKSLVLGIPDDAAPHIRIEAEAAAATLPNARLFLGRDATEGVLREGGRRSRFVHIATHGIFRQDNPMFSSIRLGNSYLNLLDLYDLELSAELVTLSGCSTGLNVPVGGDELVGLVRGLLYAGAQGALVTLWDVNDRSTADFVAAFYRHLGKSSDKAVALQRAMQELRETHPHPYYWAPFILVGKHT